MNGILYNVSAEDYHAEREGPSLSSSIIKILCDESPLHAWTAHPRLNPDYIPEFTKEQDLGTIVHALLLQGETVAELLDFADFRTKDARLARETARLSGKVPILGAKWPQVEAMVKAAHQQLEKHADASDAFTGGSPEVTLRWEEDGVKCKARLDWLHEGFACIDDLKTTGISANPDTFTRQMFANGLDIQSAWYLRGLKAITGKDAEFRFVVIEASAPHALSVIGVGPDVLTIGQKKVMWALDRWRECLSEDRWPGYPNRIVYPQLPAYVESAWLEKECR